MVEGLGPGLASFALERVARASALTDGRIRCYGVLQRRHELGVRVALGAQVEDILRMVVGEGMRLTTAAVALGLLIAWAAGRWVAPLLFETSPHDARIFGGVALALLLIALVASLIPARRAARVDPNTALRAD